MLKILALYHHPLISIHALTRRAASIRLMVCREQWNFNPRSHEESGQRYRELKQLVSYFNPRSHEESGLIGEFTMTGLGTFQSTLSRGERPRLN